MFEFEMFSQLSTIMSIRSGFRKILICSIFLYLGHSVESDCGISNLNVEAESLIAFGREIKAEQLPWIAAMYYGTIFLCGGSIGKQFFKNSQETKLTWFD